MKKPVVLTQEFVKSIPENLAENTLYISMDYGTVTHKCCCGCGREVVTPLSPTDWKLMYDGVAISLWPSIGNWSFPCRSHYWIRQGMVQWAYQWSDKQVASGRAYDRWAKEGYFTGETLPRQKLGAVPDGKESRGKPGSGFWSWLSGLRSG